MRSKIYAGVLFVSLFLVNGAYAQNKYYLSQVANGSYGTGSYRTTFILINNTDTDTTASLKLTDNAGLPLVMTITGYGASDSFTVSLPAGSSQMLQTDGLGSVATGAGKVTSATSIVVSTIFSIYDSTGNFVTETGVGNSEPQSSFVLPVDTTGLFNTGLALFNIGGDDASISLVLRDTNGTQAGVVPLTLKGNNHLAVFISGQGQLFPSISNFKGTLLVQSSIPVAAMVLRQNEAPLSFTSLPVVPTSSTKQTLNLAQVANGSYSDGSYKSSFLIFNMSSTPAVVTLSLTKDDGSPFPLTIPGQGTSSTFSIPLAAAASAFLQTDGSGSVTAGAATITSNVPIGACGIFSIFNSQGAFQTETGVGDSPVLTSMTLPVDITGKFDTGVAFFNPDNSPATLSLRLLGANGAQVGSTATINLASKQHSASFVSQIFTGTANFRGSVAISSTSGIAALTLRQNSSPLSYTTLPVASGTKSPSTSVRLYLSPLLHFKLNINPTPATSALLWCVSSTDWDTTLAGDIGGNSYKFNLGVMTALGSSGTGTLRADIVHKRGSAETVLATTTFTTTAEYKEKNATVTGVDPGAQAGDTLLLRVTRTSGNSCVAEFQGAGDANYIEIPSTPTISSSRRSSLAAHGAGPISQRRHLSCSLSFAKNQVDSLLRECRARSATLVLPSSSPEQWRTGLLATQPGVSRYDILARFSPDGHKDRLGAARSYDRCYETTDGEHRCYAARLSYRW